MAQFAVAARPQSTSPNSLGYASSSHSRLLPTQSLGQRRLSPSQHLIPRATRVTRQQASLSYSKPLCSLVEGLRISLTGPRQLRLQTPWEEVAQLGHGQAPGSFRWLPPGGKGVGQGSDRWREVVAVAARSAAGPGGARPPKSVIVIPGDGRKKRPPPGKPARRKYPRRRPPPPPEELEARLLPNSGLAAKYPLFSVMLPSQPFNAFDEEWMAARLPEVKLALGYPRPEERLAPEDHPVRQMDALLYCCFVPKDSPGAPLRSKSAATAGSRLSLLGQHVMELALAEFFLQRYPREGPGMLRERAFNLVNKRLLPGLLSGAGLSSLVFPEQTLETVRKSDREAICKSVFNALMAVGYLTLGMPEVYRLLFEVFALDPDGPSCLPTPRARGGDEDNVAPELETPPGPDGRPMPAKEWQQMGADALTPADAAVAMPRLFRAVVPPGMMRFQTSLWASESAPLVMEKLGYPLPRPGSMTRQAYGEQVAAIELALQLAYLHPSLYKMEHPRFCFERLEYVGQKIQDVVLAERLLLKYVDFPGGPMLADTHRKALRNRLCGKYLRALGLHHYIQVAPEKGVIYERNRTSRVLAQGAVHQAIHGAAYLVYGKSEVRRLMFDVWELAGGWASESDIGDALPPAMSVTST